nr:tRNA (adenosine(37)-N6)-threonylcarbamoyltransferase complex dimerization subunit type 1 TsaB [Akkermansia muciniphila]
MQDVLLVLETSCVQSSVAAWRGESLLCQAAWRAERNHSSAIFKAVRQVLDALEGRRLKEIVVGSGPGAYGGIRVALAVADGLSLVHGSRVAAFSSWNGLGLHHGEACVMSDARRGGWTWGRLENGVLTDVPAVLPAEQARASVAECMGKGVPVFPRKRRIIWPPGKCRGLSPCILLQRRSGPCGCPWRRPAEKNFWKVRRNRCM